MAKSNATWEAMGIAAMIPGLQHAAEIIQRQLDALREQLAALQNGAAPPIRRGRPPKAKAAPAKRHGGGGWSTDPEERSREMIRRNAVIKAKEEWLQKAVNRRKWEAATEAQRKAMVEEIGRAAGLRRAKTKQARDTTRQSRAALGRWQSMSARKRKEWQRKMQAGQAAKRAAAVVNLEAAS